jgi:hypothetical protein
VRRDVELIDGACDAALSALHEFADEPRRYVVALRLSGAIGLAERHRLERELKAWEARLHHLEVDDGDLVDEPTAEDLRAIDATGFVGLAVARLQAKAADANDPDMSVASMALRLMFLHHLNLRP